MSELYVFVIGQIIRFVLYSYIYALDCTFLKTLYTNLIKVAQSLYFVTSINFHFCNMNIFHK